MRMGSWQRSVLLSLPSFFWTSAEDYNSTLIDAAELFVSIPPKRGRFGLTFNDALVLGQKGSVEENRRRFEDAWRGTRTGGGRWAPLVPVEKKVDSYYS